VGSSPWKCSRYRPRRPPEAVFSQLLGSAHRFLYNRAYVEPMKKTVLTLVLSSALLVGCSLESVSGLDPSEEAQPNPEISIDTASAPAPHSELADVIEQVLPSVVNVRVTAVSLDDLGGIQEGEGEGSGVVIDEEGVIITNNHVIAGATEVEVVFNDGDSYDGAVIGTVPENDVAVIKIDADEPLEAIEIGDSDSLRLGDDVIAIGFPLDLGGTPTVTRGIVSAENRDITLGDGPVDELRGLLQTDAAINPGNSGGALIDSAGHLVGINTAAANAGSAENIGFAIPISTALPIALEIVQDPPDERAYLGVSIRGVVPALAAELGLDTDTEGALVMGIYPDSAAAEAGIERGDVIVSIAGEEITSTEDVNTVLRDLSPGEQVDVEVLRDGDIEVIELELGQRPTTLG
jgi:S1-C subfamily serine protease